MFDASLPFFFNFTFSINEVFYTEIDGKITLGINMNKLDANLHKLSINDKFLENRNIKKWRKL